MTLKEELEKNQISSNYFNLISKKSNYSGTPFKNHDLYIKHITRKLKEKYPTLSDFSCKVIANCSLVGNGYQLSDIIILDQSIFSFINHQENENPNYCYGISIHQPSDSYRNIESANFLYHLNNHNYYQVNQHGKRKIANPNDTHLETKEELKYTHFLASSITKFLKEQGYEIKLKPLDQQRSNLEIYNNGHLVLEWKEPNVSYHLFVDCNFITLATSYAKKENLEMNIALFKGKNLEVTAKLNQQFDQSKKCTIKINRDKKKYFSLNTGWQETIISPNIPTIVNMEKEKKKEQKNLLDQPTNKKRNNFFYHSIFIDQDLKDELIKIMPKITALPIIPIPDFHHNNEQIEYFQQVIMNKNQDNRKPLLISKNQKNIICCRYLKIDTCFINTGINDMVNYQSTYEVTNLKQIPQIKIKIPKSKNNKKKSKRKTGSKI